MTLGGLSPFGTSAGGGGGGGGGGGLDTLSSIKKIRCTSDVRKLSDNQRIKKGLEKHKY